jgi:hypothetical protein
MIKSRSPVLVAGGLAAVGSAGVLLVLSCGSSSTAGANQGPADGSSGDAGTSTQAGVVRCGASTCDTRATYCCKVALDPSLETCVAQDAGCSGSWSRCEKPSDCPAGEYCVVTGGTNLGGFTTECSPRANWVVCTSGADCPGGQPCTLENCRFEGGVESLSTCGGSLPTSSCTTP